MEVIFFNLIVSFQESNISFNTQPRENNKEEQRDSREDEDSVC